MKLLWRTHWFRAPFRRSTSRTGIAVRLLSLALLAGTLVAVPTFDDSATATISYATRSVTLSPTANVTTAGWTNVSGSTYWDSVDDDPDNPNDTDYIDGPAASNTNNVVTFDLTDMPSDFVAMQNLELRVRASTNGCVDDTETMDYEVIDGSNANLTPYWQTRAVPSSYTMFQTSYSTNLNANSNTKAKWDGARARLTTHWTSVGAGSDAGCKVRISAMEMRATYYSSAFSKLTQDASILENDDGATVDGTTQQAAANTAVNTVKKGERLTARVQLKNTGGSLDPSRNIGLFYDHNDGLFTKVRSGVEPITSAGTCDSITAFDCSTIESTNGYGDYNSLAFDNYGHPAISYYYAGSGSDLRYASYVGSGGSGCTGANTEWKCISVDTSGVVGQYSSLGFDENANMPSIAYYYTTGTDLKWAEYVGTGGTGCATTEWTCTFIETDGSTTDRGQYAKVAYSPDGTPWVTYYDATAANLNLRVARKVPAGTGTGCAGANTNWTCTNIDTAGDAGKYNAIAFDHSGAAWVSYYDNTNNDLMVAQYVGTGGTGCTGSTAWTCTRVDATNDVGMNTAIAIGPNGYPVVAYRENGTPNRLHYAEYVGSGTGNCVGGSSDWNCMLLDGSTDSGQHTSVGFAPDGKAWVINKDNTTDALRLERYVGPGLGSGCGATGSTAWVCQNLQVAGGSGDKPTLAFDQNGTPWISTYNSTNPRNLVVAKLKRQGELSITSGLSGTNGDALTSSHADMSSATDSANRSDADCVSATAWNPGKWWDTEDGTGLSIPAGSTTSQCTEVAFTIDTSQAIPGMTYRLVLATDDGQRADRGKWRGPVAVNNYLTFTVEANTTLRATKDTLAHFANCDNTSWGCETIRSTGNVGSASSIAADNDGNPWIAYSDATNNRIVAARYVGSGGTGCEAGVVDWSCSTVEQLYTNSTGSQITMRFLRNGRPVIAYADQTTGHVRLAQYVATGGEGCGTGITAWKCEPIEIESGSTAVGLAIDATGDVWVAFQDSSSTPKLVVGQWTYGVSGSDTARWREIAVDSTDTSGTYVSMGFDKKNALWVAYAASNNAGSAAGIRVAKYVGWSGTGCSSLAFTCTKIISNTTSAIYDTAIGFDSSSNPWIAYTDRSGGAGSNGVRMAKYVTSGGTGCSGSAAWTCTTVDNSGNGSAQLYTTIATDPRGNPWLAYRDANSDDVRVAQYVGASGTGCAGSTLWTCSTVASTGAYNAWTSIAFDKTGAPWLSMGESGGIDLKVAKLHMSPFSLGYAGVQTSSGTTNGFATEGRYRLDSGKSPSTENGSCSTNANAEGYCALESSVGDFDSSTAAAAQSPVFTFATRAGVATSYPGYSWTGQSTVAPSSKNTMLQIYRFGSTNSWVTLATNSTAAANTDFTLVGAPSTGATTEYWEADGSNFWAYYRVYQVENSSSETLRSNRFGVSNQTPNDPTSLVQTKTDDTVVATGGWVNATSAKFTASVSDPDNPDTLTLCVEVQPIASAFVNANTQCGSGVVAAGSSVSAAVTVAGLTEATEYHWQARTRDANGVYSGWVAYDVNLETARDFGIDTTAPTGGVVYDGTSIGSDAKFNDGTLGQISGNWAGFNASAAGLSKYEYSISTTPGNYVDTKTWTSVATATSFTASGLVLKTNQIYFVNVRITDLAGNTNIVSSNGQVVAPSLSFSVNKNTIDAHPYSGNGYTDTSTIAMTTSTNAQNGYVIRSSLASLPTYGGATINLFDGGSYANPDTWQVGDTGVGYTSSDTSVQGVDRFQPVTCLGSTPKVAPGCYAPFTVGGQGDVVADNPGPLAGVPITGEIFNLNVRVSVPSTQKSGNYATTLVVTCTPNF